MITQQLLKHGGQAVERFGLKVVLLVGAGCCLFPLIISGLCCCGLLLLADWR